jgi:hypothetical protein
MYKRIEDEYDGCLFHGHRLTELMLLKKGKRKYGFNSNPALTILLNEKLQEYGIFLFHTFEEGDMVFRGIGLMVDFPVENEPILPQLYGYDNFTAHIHLTGLQDYAVAFDYDVETGECVLQKHSYGQIVSERRFSNLKDMMEQIRTKGYDDVFEQSHTEVI